MQTSAFGQQHGRLGVPFAAEAEDRGRPIRAPATDTAAARSRSRRRRAAAARRRGRSRCRAGRARAARSPRSSSQSARVPGPIGSIRNASSPAAARQTLIGRGSTRPGASSMKNWPGMPGSSSPRSTRSSVYGPTGSAATTLQRSRLCRPRLMLDPLLQRVRDLLARVRDRVDGKPGAGQGRDAGHARRRARPAGSARRRAARRSPAAC